MIQFHFVLKNRRCEVLPIVIGLLIPWSEETGDTSRPVSRSGFLHYVICLFSTLCISAAAVVAGEFLINKIYFRESVVFAGGWLALACNILILSFFLIILLTLTNRLLSSLFLGLIAYGSLIAIDILKLSYLDDPVRPTDFQYLADLRVVARSSVSAWTLVGALAGVAAVAVIGWILWRKDGPAISRQRRIWTGAIACALLIGFFTIPSVDAVQDWAIGHGIVNPLAWHFEPRASARGNGLLVEWAVGTASPEISRPERYSQPEVNRIAQTYKQEEGNPVTRDGQPINLIFYLIESFMDPKDLGLPFTSDPIPTFRSISSKYSSGKVVVPVFGGTSANTEFELMTGLSMYFLPPASCPYRQYVNRDIPSLPRALRGYGYRTIAIPADPPYLFNHKSVYSHLGFERWLFPEADPQTPRSPDDEFAADGAIADKVIEVSRESGPFFIFAFTGGSHFPWDYPDYLKSSLDFVGPMPEPSRSHLKTYVNSLNVADKSLKKLLEYFGKSSQKTAILVMGDHLPALGEVYDKTGFFKGPELTQIQKRYQAPAVLWCNWPEAKEDFVCSANCIAVRMLHFMGLRANGILALNAAVQSHFPVLSHYVRTADGRLFLPQTADLPFQQLLEDYRTIQYDLLEGKQYALEVPGWK